MKNRILRTLLIVSTIVAIANMMQSCAVAADAMPSESLRFRKETAVNGIIIGSITFPKEKAKHNGYFIRVISKDTAKKIVKKNSIELQVSPEQIFKMKHKGQLDNGLTYLFAIERPEGNYEISSIRLFDNYGYVSTNAVLSGFSIPIEVKKGEITYVGTILFDEHLDKTSQEKRIKLTSNFEKDIKAFQKVQPMTDWRMVVDKKEYLINYN
ncbi:hypothetical protein [Flavobacterium sp.]|uniref:hypothetical protein n=1 Tax=Flavobacterium sp. TaxID=239 RepID=UPI0038FC13DC